MHKFDSMSGDILELRRIPINDINDDSSVCGKGESVSLVVGYSDDDVAR